MGALGQVEVKKNQAASWEKAAGGTVLNLGGMIRTGPKSQADIRFGSGIISIYDKTVLEFPPQPKRRRVDNKLKVVFLRKGHSLVRIFKKTFRGKFEVMTPSLIVEAKGTKFRVLEKEEIKAVIVMDGRVKVKNRHCLGEAIQVKSGHYTLLFDEHLMSAKAFHVTRESLIEEKLLQAYRRMEAQPRDEKRPCPSKEEIELKERETALADKGRDQDIKQKQESQAGLSFQLIPSLAALKKYDDNPTFVKDSKEPDIVTALEPGLQFAVSSSVLTGNLNYRALLDYYEQEPDLNTAKHFADLDWTVHLSEIMSLTMEDHFSYTLDSTEYHSVGVAVPRGEGLYANELDVGFNLSEFDLSYYQGDQHYDSLPFLDSVARRLEEHFAFPLLPQLKATQSYRLRLYRQWDLTKYRRVFESHTAGIGLRYYLSSTFFAGLEGGIAHWESLTDDAFRSEGMVRFDVQNQIELGKSLGHLDLKLSYLEDVESQLLAALDFRFLGTTLGVNLSRELILGGGLLVGAVTRQGAGIQWVQAIGEKNEISLGAAYAEFESINGNIPQFKTYLGEVGISSSMAPWLKGQIGYTFFIQDSSGFSGLHEFVRNQGTVSLTALVPLSYH